MGWREDLAWKEFQEFQAFKTMKKAGKGGGKGKGGKGADSKGKGKGKTGNGHVLKVPCLDSRCKVLTNRQESHCHDWWCGAPLNKDLKNGADDSLLADDYVVPARVKKKNGQKARAAKKLAAEEKTKAAAADAAATAAVAEVAKRTKPRLSYLNAAAVMKDHPFDPDTPEQMEIDAQSTAAPSLEVLTVSEKDMKRLGLPLVSGTASL